jgi:hypothetical protein
MDQLQLYREEAKKRYYEIVAKTEDEAKDTKQEKQEKDQKETECQIILDFLHQWDDIVQSFPIPSYSIEFISLELQQHIHLFIKHEMKDELQKRALRLLNLINTQQEIRTSSAEEAREISIHTKDIFELCEVDVEIAIMDTSNDLRMAEQLQYDLHMELQDPLPEIMNIPRPTIPICSLTKRVGLTVFQLRDMAKQYGLPSHGSKRDLCDRLEQAGLVQMI